MLKYFRSVKTGHTLYLQITAVALAFVAMAALSYVFMGSIVRGNLVRNANMALDFIQGRVTARLSEFETSLGSFSETMRSMAIRGASPEELREYIDDITRFAFLDGGEKSGIQDFYGYFYNLSGGPRLIDSDSRPLPSGFEAESRPWYGAALEAKGRVVSIAPSARESGEIWSTYAQAIVDDAGQTLGVVWMDVNLDIIGREIVHTALNQGGYGMMFNQNLSIMFHPNAEFLGLDLRHPSFPPHVFAARLESGREIFEEPLISYKNEKAVAFVRKLPSGWFLGLVTPEKSYYASMSRMAILLSVLGVGFAALVIGILFRLDKARARSDYESRNKSMFLANMSHEIRTPINAIVGMTAIGRAAGTTDRKDYCFSKIGSASKHLLGVVNDILDISKIEANKIELSPTNFSFEKMLQQAVNVVNFRVDEKKQKLSVYIDKSIPRILFADDQRFAQVITNLLSNAVKFTPEKGSISLKSSFLGEEGGLSKIMVEVADSGIGISPEQQKKLFRSFQQAESSTTRKYGGTGLGLAISRSIVEMMGGEIHAESAVGRGATFTFTVRVARGEDSRFDLCRYGVNWANVRILTVDDDPDILTYFREIVTGFGARCEVAASAEEALALIGRNGYYDIYFIDLRMPVEDGISLTREIRRMEKAPGKSVVIMISSSDLSAVEEEARRAGINKFLLKPLFPSAIADVISECIGLSHDKADDVPLDINGVFTGRRILFAEDNEINREIVLALLEPTGLEINCAENGLEAVKMFAATPEKYDMIFMDIQMPELDGYEATRQIRAMDFLKAAEIPIVAMTANVFKEDVDSALAAGMNGHLAKPLDVDNVIKTLYRFLRVNPIRRGPGAINDSIPE